MSRFANIRVPPVSAAINVAWQTLRQQMPDKNRGENLQNQERVHFAQANHATHGSNGEHHELSNMTHVSNNPFVSGAMSTQAEESSFNYQTSATGGSKKSMSSMDMSETSDFVEGRSEIKINEYQAAWNVTNAIQVQRIFMS